VVAKQEFSTQWMLRLEFFFLEHSVDLIEQFAHVLLETASARLEPLHIGLKSELDGSPSGAGMVRESLHQTRCRGGPFLIGHMQRYAFDTFRDRQETTIEVVPRCAILIQSHFVMPPLLKVRGSHEITLV
jgi:hypothetical protein